MKPKYFVFLLVLLLPLVTTASHNTKIDRDDLDDDVVTEFAIPVLFGASLESVRPDFGEPRGGGTRRHEGQDFVVPKGTPIVSPTEAIVIETGTWSAGGKYIQTANPGGETFRYMHLDEWATIEPGDKLDVGDYIGTVGDTGNAVPGQYHLHFEVLDKDRNPQDPYLRLTDEFTLEEKIEFLDDVFKKRRDDAEYATFLVETFPAEFRQAVTAGIDLPRAIERVIDDADWEVELEQIAALTKLIASIPTLLNTELTLGDDGARVILLQLYLLYGSDGPARDRLAAAGPTGYYGSITAAAVAELQSTEGDVATGAYDAQTRAAWVARDLEMLTLGNSQLAK